VSSLLQLFHKESLQSQKDDLTKFDDLKKAKNTAEDEQKRAETKVAGLVATIREQKAKIQRDSNNAIGGRLALDWVDSVAGDITDWAATDGCQVAGCVAKKAHFNKSVERYRAQKNASEQLVIADR